jgi:hypothetical protein
MLDQFTAAYIEAALWSSTDDNGQPLDSGGYELSAECLATMQEDCARFHADNADLIADDPARAGRDFWLTRNGHGAGFWDGDWPEPAATVLADRSYAYGECELYVSDDGLIYC